MCERLKQAVLKTAVRETVPGVRIPLPPPSFIFSSLRSVVTRRVTQNSCGGGRKRSSRLAVIDRQATVRFILAYSLALIPVTLVPTLLGMTGRIYSGAAMLFGLALFWYGTQIRHSQIRFHNEQVELPCVYSRRTPDGKGAATRVRNCANSSIPHYFMQLATSSTAELDSPWCCLLKAVFMTIIESVRERGFKFSGDSTSELWLFALLRSEAVHAHPALL